MRLLYIALLFLLFPLAVSAQVVERSSENSDFQARVGFTVDKKIVKGLHLTWNEELRMKQNVTKIDRIYSALGVAYEILPWLKAGADYTFIAVKQQVGWEFRNRSNLELTFSWRPADRWKLSLRERFRVTSANAETNPVTEANPAWIMRSRAMAEYTLQGLPLKPYVYVELSNTLNAPSVIDNYVDKIRASVGVKYIVSLRSEIDFFYRFDQNRTKEIALSTDSTPWVVTTDKQNNHILGLFYEYSF